jgi:hypothetical protein
MLPSPQAYFKASRRARTRGRALKAGEPSVWISCFAERRYGVLDDELLMAVSPRYLPNTI